MHSAFRVSGNCRLATMSVDIDRGMPHVRAHYGRGEHRNAVAWRMRRAVAVMRGAPCIMCDAETAVGARIHAIIISWQDHAARAEAIAAALTGHVQRVSVIHSTDGEWKPGATGDWHRVESRWFFGRKFRHSLDLLADDAVMLQIQADADCDDWPQLARRCAQAFATRPRLGIWSPEIAWTPWPTSRVALAAPDRDGVVPVAQSDGVVWALAPGLAAWMATLDYSRNNLGWGIDWVAVTRARTAGLDVMRDTLVHVRHPHSRGYSGLVASQHMKNFLAQLSPSVSARFHRTHAQLHQRLLESSAQAGISQRDAADLPPFPPVGEPYMITPVPQCVSEAHLFDRKVYVRGEARYLARGAHVVCGTRRVALVPMDAAPEFGRVPVSFPSAPPPGQPAHFQFNDLGDWQPAGRPTLRIIPSGTPGRLELGSVLEVPAGTGALEFCAELANHRSIADLSVSISAPDGRLMRDLKVRFDPQYSGGTELEKYQPVRLRLPAMAQGGLVSLAVRFRSAPYAKPNSPPVLFVSWPRLVAAHASGFVRANSLLGSPGAGDGWYMADISGDPLQAGEQVALQVDNTTVPLLVAAPARVQLGQSWGHALQILSDAEIQGSLWIDGAAAGRFALTSGGNFVALPTGALDGRHHFLQLRDLSGTQVFWQDWVLTTRQITPVDVLQREGKPPFPSDAFAQTPFRTRGLTAHLRAGTAPEILSQLGPAFDALEAGAEGLTLAPLAFPRHDTPQVSVVIPVHGKLRVTYACLAALLLAHNRASFEVIVVDDASPDATATIEELVSGITVVRNTTPQRFIRACNAGVAQARGEHIVLLNNDTEPTAGWLDALLDAFGRFDNVGLAGAKLIYPDGRLQEAGGIVWDSGNPWNYGNGQNPWEPRFCYARQADYLSGAALMTTRAVWDKVGGLSEYLEPMYFEDTDLAFKIRAAGYTTWFVSGSVVFHYEGATSGTDTSSGFKQFQEINRPRFKRRWADAFAHLGSEGQLPDLAKDRGILGRVLFIDHAVPTPDQDAGSYAALQEMRLVQSLGYKVTFLPENLAHIGGYVTALQDAGVEVITAPFVRSTDEFLQSRAGEFDLFFITRYNVARSFVEPIRAIAPQARIILNNADLHFLRLLRMARATGDEAALDAARRVRSDELEAMQSVDVVLSYSNAEHAVIEAQSEGAVRVMKCPCVLECPDAVPGRDGRKGLSFLGGFRHLPNVEGAVWFARNVMPELERVRPGVKLSIHGAQMPPEVRDLTGPAIDPVGFVADAADAYDNYLIFVAPLLSGAGIKGKVLTALARGIPCVLSPVAAEGIGLVHGRDAMIAETPADWVGAITALHDDPALWQRIADSGRALAEAEFSFEQGRRAMRAAFEAVGLFRFRD